MWTEHAGEVWVACQADCLDAQLMLDGSRNPPLIALCEDPQKVLKEPEVKEGGKGTPEGRESNTSGLLPQSQVAPPPGFLNALWEGDWDGQTIRTQD